MEHRVLKIILFRETNIRDIIRISFPSSTYQYPGTESKGLLLLGNCVCDFPDLEKTVVPDLTCGLIPDCSEY